MSERRTFHIIYIPGLGDAYDTVRRAGLALWRRPQMHISHMPMNWLDPAETYEEKLSRIDRVVRARPGDTPVFVGESAGGPVAIDCLRRYVERGAKAVTICGMNQGADSVSRHLYIKNRAFHSAMLHADMITPRLTGLERDNMLTLYSSHDMAVRPRDTLLDGVEAIDLRIPSHQLTILAVLFWKYRLIIAHLRNR